jgi:hypothetical protein
MAIQLNLSSFGYVWNLTNLNEWLQQISEDQEPSDVCVNYDRYMYWLALAAGRLNEIFRVK